MDLTQTVFAKMAPIFMANTTTATSTTTTATTSTSNPVNVTNQNYVTISHNKPRNYAGERPQDWIRQYEMLCTGNGWDKTRKLQNIPALFFENGRGKNWYRVTFGMNPPADWDDFCNKMIAGLGPAHQKFSSFQNMNDRRMGMNEGATDYYFSKLSLISEHDPSMDEEMKVNIIQNGLRNDVKKRVFGKAKDLNSLFELLKNEDFLHKNEANTPVFMANYEPYNQQQPNFNPRPYSNNNYRGYRQPNRGQYRPYALRNQQPNYNQYNCQGSNYQFTSPSPYPSEMRYRGSGVRSAWPRSMPPRFPVFNQRDNYVTCYRCGIVGHTSRDCRVQIQRPSNYRPNYNQTPSAPPPSPASNQESK